MISKIKPDFYSVEQWKLIDAGFGGPMISILPDLPLTFHTFVKVGEWEDHEIIRHLYCVPDKTEACLNFSYADFEDDHFFDFENLHGNKELFKDLQDTLFSIWKRDADMAVKYTDGHMDSAAALFAERIDSEITFLSVSPEIKDLIEKACKERRFNYMDAISLRND